MIRFLLRFPWENEKSHYCVLRGGLGNKFQILKAAESGGRVGWHPKWKWFYSIDAVCEFLLNKGGEKGRKVCERAIRQIRQQARDYLQRQEVFEFAGSHSNA